MCDYLNLPQCNIYVIGIPEGVNRENWKEVILEELMSVNFPELINNLKPHLKVTSPDQHE